MASAAAWAAKANYSCPGDEGEDDSDFLMSGTDADNSDGGMTGLEATTDEDVQQQRQGQRRRGAAGGGGGGGAGSGAGAKKKGKKKDKGTKNEDKSKAFRETVMKEALRLRGLPRDHADHAKDGVAALQGGMQMIMDQQDKDLLSVYAVPQLHLLKGRAQALVFPPASAWANCRATNKKALDLYNTLEERRQRAAAQGHAITFDGGFSSPAESL